jgi:hypothetical protein
MARSCLGRARLSGPVCEALLIWAGAPGLQWQGLPIEAGNGRWWERCPRYWVEFDGTDGRRSACGLHGWALNGTGRHFQALPALISGSGVRVPGGAHCTDCPSGKPDKAVDPSRVSRLFACLVCDGCGVGAWRGDGYCCPRDCGCADLLVQAARACWVVPGSGGRG